jgi:hypothetical protein
MSRLAQLIDVLGDPNYMYHYRSAKSSHTCMICGNQASAFTDESAELEFKVSGLCQQCQDEYLGDKKVGNCSD